MLKLYKLQYCMQQLLEVAHTLTIKLQKAKELNFSFGRSRCILIISDLC
ncbi:hypothetical protein X975_18816, partial [Stegodyphus mimosarum]